jgi:uncharacterized protein RhaS with RHS repeats
LYDYRKRFYSPSLGKFLQVDPLRFESGDLNLYRYVANSVPNFIDPFGLQMVGMPGSGLPSYGAIKSPVQYPRGFAIATREIQKDGSCDCPAIFANTIGGEHTYIQFVSDDGSKWGYGFGGRTGKECAFNPATATPCSRSKCPLQHGSGTGKAGTEATDDEIKDCIKNHAPTKQYSAWGSDRYNCRDWALEAAKSCGLDCN